MERGDIPTPDPHAAIPLAAADVTLQNGTSLIRNARHFAANLIEEVKRGAFEAPYVRSGLRIYGALGL